MVVAASGDQSERSSKAAKIPVTMVAVFPHRKLGPAAEADKNTGLSLLDII